jgi:hypothetical protein
MDLASDPRVITALFGNSTDERKYEPKLLRISLVDMRTYRLQYFIPGFDLFAFVSFPERLDFLADLLVDFLLDIVLAFVQHRDIVRKHCHFNLWALSAIEGWLPSLNKES